MATLLQLHFSFNGPFGDTMAEQLKPLAESINQEPGFLWKVWTESEKNGYTDLMVDGAPLPHQPDTIIRWLIDRPRS